MHVAHVCRLMHVANVTVIMIVHIHVHVHVHVMLCSCILMLASSCVSMARAVPMSVLAITGTQLSPGLIALGYDLAVVNLCNGDDVEAFLAADGCRHCCGCLMPCSVVVAFVCLLEL